MGFYDNKNDFTPVQDANVPFTNTEGALDWDSVIEKDSSDFVLLPVGQYDFTIVNLEKKQYQGGEKMGPCPQADITIRVIEPESKEPVDVTTPIFLHKKTEGIMSAFLVAIGQKKRGEPCRPNWNAMIGLRGRCEISHRSWTGNDGQEMKSNNVKKWLEPQAAPVSQQQQFKAGQF
ncbi:hypothetical protein K5I04_04820 [Murdochiella sp. Marseille-P8839]|nr:hypothetical protein [Murdochiella sp. Marseille-P8839]